MQEIFRSLNWCVKQVQAFLIRQFPKICPLSMLHPFGFVLLKACHVPFQSVWLIRIFSRLVIRHCIHTVTSSKFSLKC